MTDQPKTRKSRYVNMRNVPQVQSGDVVDGIAKDLNEVEENANFIKSKRLPFVAIRPTDIVKTYNARSIPCTFEEFSQVAWPSLELVQDEAGLEIVKILETSDQPWIQALDKEQKHHFAEFMVELHELARSMKDSSQFHPITVEQVDDYSTSIGIKTYLIDGERRTLAALYSRGEIPFLTAFIHKGPLSAERIAAIKSEANLHRPLLQGEKVSSYLSIYLSNPQLKGATIREVASALKTNKHIAKTVINLSMQPDSAELLETCINQRLSLHQIDTYILYRELPKDANEGGPAKTEAESGSDRKEREVVDTDEFVRHNKIKAEIRQYNQSIKNTLKVPTDVKYDKRTGTVKMTLSMSVDSYKEHTEAIKAALGEDK